MAYSLGFGEPYPRDKDFKSNIRLQTNMNLFDMLNEIVCIYILNLLHTNFNFTEKNCSSNLFNISSKVRVSWRCVLHVLLTSVHQSTLHILYIVILQQPLQQSSLCLPLGLTDDSSTELVASGSRFNTVTALTTVLNN